MGELAVELALHVRAAHAEGPLWDAGAQLLWWVDIVGQRVHSFDPASGRDCSWATAGQPGGVLCAGDGSPVVLAPDGLEALDPATGATTPVVPLEADHPENRANDGKVDSRGRAWVGTMAYDKRPGNAALYRIEDRRAVAVVAGLTISNGPALDERAGRLYLADTALGRVDVFDWDVDDGTLAGRRRFLDVSADGLWPDGMTVDDQGALWVALGRSGSVQRYTPDGRRDAVVELPTSNPTSLCFGGADGSQLYVTTSWFDLPEAQRRDQPLAGGIFCCDPGVRGAPSPRLPVTAPST